jgi:hypothetical protein
MNIRECPDNLPDSWHEWDYGRLKYSSLVGSCRTVLISMLSNAFLASRRSENASFSCPTHPTVLPEVVANASTLRPYRSRCDACLQERTSFDAPRRDPPAHSLPQERQKIPSHRRVRRGKLRENASSLLTSTAQLPVHCSPHSPPNRGRIHPLNALYPSREGIYPPSDFERA